MTVKSLVGTLVSPDEIVDVGETLPLVQAQLAKRHLTRVVLEGRTADTRTAVFLAVDTEVM